MNKYLHDESPERKRFLEWLNARPAYSSTPLAEAAYDGWLAAIAAQERAAPMTVDALANEIRRVDGNHSLGAGALAEAILPFIQSAALALQRKDVQRLEYLLTSEDVEIYMITDEPSNPTGWGALASWDYEKRRDRIDVAMESSHE